MIEEINDFLMAPEHHDKLTELLIEYFPSLADSIRAKSWEDLNLLTPQEKKAIFITKCMAYERITKTPVICDVHPMFVELKEENRLPELLKELKPAVRRLDPVDAMRYGAALLKMLSTANREEFVITGDPAKFIITCMLRVKLRPTVSGPLGTVLIRDFRKTMEKDPELHEMFLEDSDEEILDGMLDIMAKRAYEALNELSFTD